MLESFSGISLATRAWLAMLGMIFIFCAASLAPARADTTGAYPTGATGQIQQAASAPLPMGANYHIHSGDQLSVQVFNEPTLSQNTTVLPDGGITYPLAGRIVVVGLSSQAAADRIAHALAPYVRHPSVTVTINQAAQYTVLVLGNVKVPGRYQMRSDGRVTDAIAAAGGLGTTNGDLPIARISQPNGVATNSSLQRLFRQGDVSQNLALGDGSVVYVPSPVSFEVEVVGAVDHPGNIEINEGDHLSMAIARAGNSSNSSADLNHIRVTRTTPNGSSVVYQINLYETLEKGNRKVDIPLQKGDVVYVPQAKRAGGAGTASALFLLQRLAGFSLF